MTIRSPFNCDKHIGEEKPENKLKFECLNIGNKVTVVDSLSVLDCAKKPVIKIEWKSCSNVTLEKRNNNPGMFDNTYKNTAIMDFTRFGFPECKSVIGNEPWKYVPRKERKNIKDNDKRAIVKAEKGSRKFPVDAAAQNSKFNKNQKPIQKENTEILRSSYKNNESIIKIENKLKTGEITNLDNKHHLNPSLDEKLKENEYEKSKVSETPNLTATDLQNGQSSDINSNDKLRSNETKEPEVIESVKTNFKENSRDLKSTSNDRLGNDLLRSEDPTVQFTTSDKKQPSSNENDDGFIHNVNKEFSQNENETPNKQQQINCISEEINKSHDEIINNFSGQSTQKGNDDTNLELTSLTPNKQQQVINTSEKKVKSHGELINNFSGQSTQKDNEDTNVELTSLTPNVQQQVVNNSERKIKSSDESVNGVNGQLTQKTRDDTNAVLNKQREKIATSEGIIQNEYTNKNDLESGKNLVDNYNKNTRINNTENIELDRNGKLISNSKNSETINGIKNNPNLINSFDFVNAITKDYDKALNNPKNINDKIKKESNRTELLTSKNADKKFDKHDTNRISAKTNPSSDPPIKNNIKNISDINNKPKIIKHIDFKATNPFACIDINNRDRGNTPVNFILPPDFCQVQKKEIQKPVEMKPLEKVKYIPLTFCDNSKMRQ